MRIFLIRHGEPEQEWGEGDDPGLSARGRAQAGAASVALTGIGGLAIVSSPMLRCRETAAPFAAAMGAGVALEPRVSEVATAIGAGDRRAWLQRNFPWRSATPPTQWAALEPGLRAWRDAILEKASAWREDCAVFTHFIAINALVGAAMGRTETIVCRPDFASITELAFGNGQLSLLRLGAQIEAGEVR